MAKAKQQTRLDDLLEIMVKLRDPVHGCPWDQQQTFATISPYTIEEAHEVADVIAREAWSELPGELGDLLFQVAFYARLAEENGWFDFADVLEAICSKMVRRHPHVFADKRYANVAEQTRAWEQIKSDERGDHGRQGVLDGIGRGLSAFRTAEKLQKRAAGVGFDWPDVRDVLDKLDEEIAELKFAIHDTAAGDNETRRAQIEDELGDVLFCAVNLARHLELGADHALRKANLKFARRFRQVEALASATKNTLEEMDLAAMEALWQRAKTVLREQ